MPEPPSPPRSRRGNMDRDSIMQLIKEINGASAEIQHNQDWVNSSCPLAPWLHESGHDRQPSFGIKAEENEVSRFFCFTCKSSGSVLDLLKLIADYSEDRSLLEQYEPTLTNEEFAGGPLPEWNYTKPVRRSDRIRLVPLGEEYEDLYDPLDFEYRGVSLATAQRIGLGVGGDSRGVSRIVFPVKGLNGELYGHTGRATDPDATPRIRDFHGLRKELLLLGLHTLPKDPPYVVLVEGLFAYAKVLQAGEPVVASMHANLTQHQAQWLIRINRPVVIFYDHDKAGRSGTKIAANRLINHVPVRRVVYPKDTPPKTDPDDLDPRMIRNLIRRAKLICTPPQI